MCNDEFFSLSLFNLRGKVFLFSAVHVVGKYYATEIAGDLSVFSSSIFIKLIVKFGTI